MRNIYIPKTVEEYQHYYQEKAFPDPRILQNDFYRRAHGWVVDHRTPIPYEQDHDDEYTNLSINFNWLLIRDYSNKKDMGNTALVASMYALHEEFHMTFLLPTRLDELSDAQYAEMFAGSETRASNETEIQLHYRMPELRKDLFPDTKIVADIMKDRGIPQLPSSLLNKIRPLFIEHNELDFLLGDDPEVVANLERMKHFNGNRRWAKEHFKHISRYFVDGTLPLNDGLIDEDYEETIASYEPGLTQSDYENNIVRNVRFGFGMIGEPIPKLTRFEEAREAAEDLEGKNALVVR
jgi:hypothetical protein